MSRRGKHRAAPRAKPNHRVDSLSRSEKHLAVLAARRDELGAALEKIFSRPASFVWEIGCGHGHFLTAYARSFPERHCIGIDITSDRIERAERKRVRAGLSNLHFIQAEARFFLEHLPASAAIQDVIILFPDPWPKKRHHKNRILQESFLTDLARRAGPETRLYFRTDYAPYLAEARRTLQTHEAWEIVDEPWAFEHETVFQSRADTFGSLVARRRGPAP